MTLVLCQIVFSLLAGWGVFALWRRIASTSRAVFWLVTAGFLIRAIGGLLAFWISYLSLPIGRSLQLGDGLWIFAFDAKTYLPLANSLALAGPAAIIHVLKVNTSVFFTQTLATAILLFGSSVATALLLNIAAYLGCCLVALSFGDPRKHTAVVVAIAALSLDPSAILWSLQPLKDVLFLFLVGLFFAVARMWQQVWIEERQARTRLAATASALAMAVALYGVSGIRWYFGAILVIAVVPFVTLTAFRADRRLAAAAASVVLVPLLVLAFYVGAGPFVPVWMSDAVVKRDYEHQVALPGQAIQAMNSSRQGFENSAGTTLIGAGKAVKNMDASMGAAERRVALRELVFSPTASQHDQSERLGKPQPSSNGKNSEVSTTTLPVKAAPVQTAGVQTAPAALPPPAQSTAPAVAPRPSPAHSGPGDARHPPAAQVANAGKPAQPIAGRVPNGDTKKTEAPATTQPRPGQTVERKSQPPASGETTAEALRARQSAVAAADPTRSQQAAARDAAQEGVSNAGIVSLPTAPLSRLLVGTAAIVLPRSLAQRLGIIEVRGGRGLWLVAEIDTLFFDAILIFSLSALAQAAWRRRIKAPIFWMLLLVMIGITGALAYTVTNFGTLFRHRDMVLLVLVLLPLATLAAAGEAVQTTPEPEAVPAALGRSLPDARSGAGDLTQKAEP